MGFYCFYNCNIYNFIDNTSKFEIFSIACSSYRIWYLAKFCNAIHFLRWNNKFHAYLVINAIQLGATVDYAILLTTKYKEYRKRFEPNQSAYLASTSSAMTILTSALIMAGACFSVFFISTNLVLKEMTFLMARGSIISSILVIFILPALLILVDNNKEIKFILCKRQNFDLINSIQKDLKNEKNNFIMLLNLLSLRLRNIIAKLVYKTTIISY